MILLSLLFVSFMFKTKQGSAWTLHCGSLASLSELPISGLSLSSRLQESSPNHKLGPSCRHWSWTGAETKELEREESHFHFRVTVAADTWPRTGAHLPRSALHRAASCLQSLVCSAVWAFLLMKCCLPRWRVCSELSHSSGWSLTGHAVFPHFSKTLQLKVCIET